MKYTITKKDIIGACLMRSGQVKQAKAELAKALEAPETQWEAKRIKLEYAPKLVTSWAYFAFVNGDTYTAALPVTRLKQWAQCAPADTFECTVAPGQSNRLAQITLRAGNSAVTMFGRASMGKEVSGLSRYRNTEAHELGAPIRLVAPAEGGQFVHQDSIIQNPQ